jgi:hypothetical protein
MIFADIELARRLERPEALAAASFAEARGRLTPGSDATWIEVAGTYAVFDGPDSPVTQTFGLGLYAPLTTADLDVIEKFFQERGAPVNHEVSPFAGLQVADLLSRRGYRPIEFTSVMYKAIGPENVALEQSNQRLTTRLIGDDEQELWSRVSARAWSEHPELTEFLFSLGQVAAVSKGSLMFFAHLDGEPVATAVLRCHEGVALLGGACTVPAARKCGAQRALLEARMRAASHLGCDLAMMGAEPGSTSQRNAERQGFRIAYTRIKWQLRSDSA